MSTKTNSNGLSLADRTVKRTFDFFFALFGLLFSAGPILVAYIIATIDTKQNGFFVQSRIGKDGKPFKLFKIRTMRNDLSTQTSVTCSNDPRITRVGKLLRRMKFDELPQLLNVLIGNMSFVGPRPDVPGFADELSGNDRIILSVKPGITGPATLYFRNEEELLAEQPDPEQYNCNVIYKKKIELNRQYIENYSFLNDLKYLWHTLFKR